MTRTRSLSSFYSTMSSGMCKICTHLFSVQLTFIKNIIDVASYNSSVFLKQLSHLSLRQPHRLILQADINLRLSVLRLIDYNLVLVHFAFRYNHSAKIQLFSYPSNIYLLFLSLYLFHIVISQNKLGRCHRCQRHRCHWGCST